MKKLALLAALLMSVIPAGAQAAGTSKGAAASKHASTAGPKLPTKEEVDAALKRIYGYDPSIQWRVALIRKSPVPGMAQVFVQLKNEYKNLYLTADGHFAITGDLMPFGKDPYAIYRTKLKAADGLARGPAKPAVTMVEFSDLECPHCRDAQPVIEKLAADFPQMKIIFQQYPLPSHPWAMKAAQYADCAGRMNNDAGWKFIASIYQNQGNIALAIADEKLKELAKGAGLDVQKLSACATAPATEARVKKSMDLGESVGVLGTPSIFLNGRPLEAVVGIPYEQVKALVKYEIEHAGR